MRSRIVPRVVGALVWATAAVGCGATGLVDAANRGDFPGLRRQITVAQGTDAIDREAIEELSVAVLTRDFKSVEGEQAEWLVDLVGPCSSSLVALLREVAHRADGAASRASIALLEAGQLPADELIRRARGETGAHWRVALARASAGTRWGRLRRRLATDGDQYVRRAALRAALEARDPQDLDVLLEAVRLDPDAESRALAARAAGAIGGHRAVLGLRDRWPKSDPETRLVIVDGWGFPRSYRAGGRYELIRVAEQQSSLAALRASALLAHQRVASTSRAGRGPRWSTPRSARAEPDSVQLGRHKLARILREGTRLERLAAMSAADLREPEQKKALKQAADDPDGALRVRALGLLARHPPTRLDALRRLRKLSGESDATASMARWAIAQARDPGAVPFLVRKLVTGSPQHRIRAALLLVEHGRWSRVAFALADPSLEVRARTACAVLSAE